MSAENSGRQARQWLRLTGMACVVAVSIAWPCDAYAQSTAIPAPASDVALPQEDDATLRDVTFCGDRIGLAVGDRGVVWRTSDGGRSWRFVRSGTTASLRSVQLLTDRLGWAIGYQIDAGSGLASGVVLATQDGGATWRRHDHGVLPGLRAIRFFDAENGYVAGDSSTAAPTGIFVTRDGGATWTAVEGPSTGGWQAFAFLNESQGVLVGDRGQQGILGNGRLLPIRPTNATQGLRDVAMGSDRRGWIVGDGGLVRRTENGGASWPDPPQSLPLELRDALDLRTVAMQGDRVWLAGSPGSVVWHSFDDGYHWAQQPTGETAPIESLHFVNETQGIAVGAFGRISRTDDGGKTWQTVRGGSRRAAFMTLLGKVSQMPAGLLVQQSAEQGYRSVVSLPVRRDVGSKAADHHGERERLRAAILAAGGNDAEINWRLPVARPDIDREPQQLISEWSRLTDQRLTDVLLGHLVAELRTWRPEILVLGERTEHDAVTGLLEQAVLLAVEQAGDPTRYPEQQSLLGLQPWQVQKVFARFAEPQPGMVTVDPQQMLLRQRQTVEESAIPVMRLLGDNSRMGERVSWRLIATAPTLRATASGQSVPLPIGSGLFTGLPQANSPEIRRDLLPLNGLDEEQLLQLAKHRRNFLSYAERLLDDPSRGQELLAHLESTTRPLPPDQAARLLADLAEEYRSRSRWESVEETFIQLVERYPDQPAAREAMTWLLANWTSQEMLWQRLRVEANTRRTTFHRDENVRTGAGLLLQKNVADALEIARQSDNILQAEARMSELPAVQPVMSRSGDGSIRQGGTSNILQVGAQNLNDNPGTVGVNQRDHEQLRRQQQARLVTQVLQRVDPALFQQPQVQFLIAALMRQQQQVAAAGEIYRRFFGADDGSDPWYQAARGELWITSRGPLSPRPVVPCRRAATPPVLDGILSDACWQNATEVKLTATPPPSANGTDTTFVGTNRLETNRGPNAAPPPVGPSAIVMLAYDERFLYFAVSVPRSDSVRTDMVQLAGRTHDADLASFDRVSLSFDVDRDYSTFYRFDVDQRGWTRDVLWEDVRWNPQWYVAADADNRYWRIESAIPWEELAAAPPARGTVWAAGFHRIIPLQGIQSWTHPASETPRGETFGLVRFE